MEEVDAMKMFAALGAVGLIGLGVMVFYVMGGVNRFVPGGQGQTPEMPVSAGPLATKVPKGFSELELRQRLDQSTVMSWQSTLRYRQEYNVAKMDAMVEVQFAAPGKAEQLLVPKPDAEPGWRVDGEQGAFTKLRYERNELKGHALVDRNRRLRVDVIALPAVYDDAKTLALAGEVMRATRWDAEKLAAMFAKEGVVAAANNAKAQEAVKYLEARDGKGALVEWFDGRESALVFVKLGEEAESAANWTGERGFAVTAVEGGELKVYDLVAGGPPQEYYVPGWASGMLARLKRETPAQGVAVWKYQLTSSFADTGVGPIAKWFADMKGAKGWRRLH